MTFEAYIKTIREKTGKGPLEFFDEAVAAGALLPGTKTMQFVDWLKARSGLGHGHAMAVWEAFKREGWVPLQAGGRDASKTASKTKGGRA
ncbi:hypothetical protein GCM10028796_22440 [Ramlibacter monticola]|uniref:DUF4287 domain-containing protein n=1 Tax=Ramlibacter monticola TaxID=1926872 RepID=A0A936YZU5_9BURK|nr:DUF4287 domain-containing protein [Ramlibacter monticola]